MLRKLKFNPMKTKITLLLFLSLLFGSAFSQQDAAAIFEELQFEQDSQQKEKLKTELQTNFPNSVYTAILGYLEMSEEELLENANIVLRKFPQNPWGYYLMGIYKLEYKDSQQDARHYFEDALRFDKDFWRSYAKLAWIDKQMGFYDDAEKFASKAINLKENDDLYLLRGLIRGDMYKIKKALTDFEKAIEINPRNDRAYYTAAYAFSLLYELEDALTYINEAIKLEKKDAEYYYLRGNILLDLDSPEEALENYAYSMVMDSLHWQAMMMSGWVKAIQEEFEDAQLYFTKALEIEEDAEIYYYRGLSYYEKDEYEKAEQDFSKAIDMFYDEPDLYYYRGYCRYENGKSEQACADMKIAADLGDRDAKAFYRQNCK